MELWLACLVAQSINGSESEDGKPDIGSNKLGLIPPRQARTRGVVSWTCDPVLRGLIPVPILYSSKIPLGKVLTYITKSSWMGLKIGCPVSVHIYDCKIPSHSSKKSRPLWLVMMDNSAPKHERRKLVKTYKKVLPQKRTVVAEVYWKT